MLMAAFGCLREIEVDMCIHTHTLHVGSYFLLSNLLLINQIVLEQFLLVKTSE
jgi:hypothetical protein